MKINIVAIIYIFIFMIIVGFSENMRGLFIPIFKDDFNINNSMIGIMLTVSSLGYILFQYVGGILIQKHGHRRAYFFSLILIILSFLILSWAPNFYILLLAMFIFNLGVSLFSIGTNSIIPILFASYQAILMNLTHFCYGFGTSMGQRFTGIFLKNGVAWRTLYFWNGIIFSLLLVIFFFIRFPQVEIENEDEEVKFINVIRNKKVFLFIIALGLYVFSELSISNWFANFMITNYKFDTLRASAYLSLFFLVFTIGRFLGGFIVERFGYFNSLIFFFSVAATLFTLGLIGREKYIILISISGFFFSIGFPTIVVIVNNTFKIGKTYILGIIIAATSSINMILSFLVGYLNDRIGTYLTFFLIPISLIISLLTLLKIMNSVDNKL
ncbi:Purine efflux pump PbuE [Caloramator mitchellensis]|uniref:Purine efflux pump PbuE n=1 Tax=Caloramator mitchellensis TaxID=908809 RepID=A0A0R3JUJ7_CALMK|nr:MFS transporter [Caloramator mitchellensis]KRQ87239.1 Purine efflux pump PbuE [Caloramator mitchellensis]